MHICVIYMCDMTHSYVWHDSFMCATWLIHTCDMTHSYVWHDSFTCVTWLIHMCDMTHSYVWHDSFVRVTCLIHMCDMIHSHVWRDCLIADKAQSAITRCHWLFKKESWVTILHYTHIWTSHVTHYSLSLAVQPLGEQICALKKSTRALSAMSDVTLCHWLTKKKKKGKKAQNKRKKAQELCQQCLTLLFVI